jgi:iron complex outermembrane receptor protein
MIKSMRAAALATTALSASMIAGSALAQSSGTIAAEAAVSEEIVVTGQRGPRNVAGAIVAVEEPKSRAVLTQEFISTAVPGQSILDTINLLPSVTFTNSDAFGSAGGDVSVRGFDSQRVALLFDGVPLNDSGNYEIYPNQQLDPELIESVTVNLGTTDVDSPRPRRRAGTINVRDNPA